MANKQNEDKDYTPWILIETVSKDILANHYRLININCNEFLSIPEYNGYNIKPWGIHKYDTRRNIWTKFIEYPNEFESNDHAVTFNKHNHSLYIAGCGNQMVQITLNDKKFDIIRDKRINFGLCSSLVTVNDNVHLIGGSGNTKHSEWDNQCNEFKEVFDFKSVLSPNLSAIGASSLFIPSKQILLLIGGVLRADRGCHAMENIWIYSVKLNKWNKTNIKLKLIRPRIVLSSDEKYVIIMSGRDDN